MTKSQKRIAIWMLILAVTTTSIIIFLKFGSSENSPPLLETRIETLDSDNPSGDVASPSVLVKPNSSQSSSVNTEPKQATVANFGVTKIAVHKPSIHQLLESDDFCAFNNAGLKAYR
jgi:hypothetical protein